MTKGTLQEVKHSDYSGFIAGENTSLVYDIMHQTEMKTSRVTFKGLGCRPGDPVSTFHLSFVLLFQEIWNEIIRISRIL